MKRKKSTPTSNPNLNAAVDALIKPKAGASPATGNREIAFRMTLKEGQTHADYTAELWTGGVFGNAATAQLYSENLGGHGDLATVLTHMQQRAAAVTARNLGGLEAMLAAQAVALNAVFTDLAILARANVTRAPETFERCLRLALRAQNQSRATAETLALMQNPTGGAVFAKQANIAHGPQQVNNRPAAVASRTEESESQPNRLLEAHGERMDSTAATATGAGNPTMEAVGAVHRPVQHRRQSASRTERL